MANPSFSISRRQFLFGAGATTLLLTLATTYQHVGSYPTNDLNLRYLSDKEAVLYRIIGDW